ncbi:MAG: hypothetical protein PVF89_07235, partial [Lysobacterales bacterium]
MRKPIAAHWHRHAVGGAMSFIQELKRRNVFKVAAAYLIVAWLIMQAGDTLAPALHLPDWINSALAFFLVLGFPLAMIFAWAFEMTPDGLKKEKDVDRTQSITHVTGQKLNYAIIALLTVALAYFVWESRFREPVAGPSQAGASTAAAARGLAATTSVEKVETENSIAVLPFVNMSDDAGNEYFSEGLSEELLNLLAKIPNLKVAARTSSFQFKGKSGDIESIARQLRVNHVLEGSVRKAGDQVRITAQLIKADDGYHLWSETYDRKLENIFTVQDEIAAAVVDALKVKLLGAAPPVATVADPAAYAQYLQGKYLINQTSRENVAKAAAAFQRAIDIDRGYAPAWAGLSRALLFQAGQGWVKLEEGLATARTAAERSVSLDPGLASGWVVLSRIQGPYDWRWNDASDSMQKALQFEPQSSVVLSGAANLAASLGQLDRAIDYFRQASALDPLNQNIMNVFSGVLESAGQLPEALELTRRLHVLNPDYFAIHATLGWLQLRQGHPDQALAELDSGPMEFWAHWLKINALYSLGKQQDSDAELATFIAENH